MTIVNESASSGRVLVKVLSAAQIHFFLRAVFQFHSFTTVLTIRQTVANDILSQHEIEQKVSWKVP